MNVIMFHSVGNHKSPWRRKWLSVHVNQFELFCRFLTNNNYDTFFLDEWYELQKHPQKTHQKQVVLTFDDGYIDNWVYVYPILKKHNLKGTIFVNPEFIDGSNGLRPNYDDVIDGKVSHRSLTKLGFLNWEEIKALDKSNNIDIQSHSMSHNNYFCSDKLIDIYTGQDKYDWVSWILKPERKPYYIFDDLTSYLPMGYPIFENNRALAIRRFIPSQRFIENFTENYERIIKNGNITKPLNNLKKFTEEFKSKHGKLGNYESEQEVRERYEYELYESKKILEKKLNKTVNYLCWPGGGYNELSIKISIDAGYKASTIASWDKKPNIDNSLTYKRIRRFGLSSKIGYKSVSTFNNSQKYLIYTFLSRNSLLYRSYVRMIKVPLVLNHFVGKLLNRIQL